LNQLFIKSFEVSMNSNFFVELSDNSAQGVSGGSTTNRTTNITLNVNKKFNSEVKIIGQAADADAYAYAYGKNSLAEVYTTAETGSWGSEATSNSIAVTANCRPCRPARR
jgi:hypothetical protein